MREGLVVVLYGNGRIYAQPLTAMKVLRQGATSVLLFRDANGDQQAIDVSSIDRIEATRLRPEAWEIGA